MLKEFRNFISRGNVIDLATAVIIGGAFSAIVSSLVEHIITPGLLNPLIKQAQVDKLDQLQWNSIQYGSFLAAVLNFLIVAFVIFFLVRTINKIQERFASKPDAPDAPPLPADVALLTEIRDLLKENRKSEL